MVVYVEILIESILIYCIGITKFVSDDLFTITITTIAAFVSSIFNKYVDSDLVFKVQIDRSDRTYETTLYDMMERNAKNYPLRNLNMNFR